MNELEAAELELENIEETDKESKIAVQTDDLSVYFDKRAAIENINIKIRKNRVTAIIGPSGCGKSTFLRAINLMHDMVPRARVFGTILINGENISNFNAVDIRKKVGMVFQKPNPFPTMSIYENVIAGMKLNGITKKSLLNEVVEKNLIYAGLWDEVKDG